MHRVEEQFKRAVSRFSSPPRLPCKYGGPLPRFPAMRESLEALAANPELMGNWRQVANSVIAGKIRLLGMDWPEHAREDRWSTDPASGKAWPRDQYCFSIPYRHSDDMGDVKYVWEVNRLQYLQAIAALAVLDKNDDLRRFCTSEIESWIDNNPPYKGVAWASGIELSCRLVSLIVVITLLGDDAFTATQREKICSTLVAHGYWLYRYPSRYSSANNHLVAEAAGLFLLGMLAPWIPQSQKWASYGRRIILTEVERQILADGVGAEQSPTYLAFVLEWLVLCAFIMKHSDQIVPPRIIERLEKAGEYLWWITDACGNQPRIGDDDEGRVLFAQLDSAKYICAVIGCVGGFLEKDEIAPPVDVPGLWQTLTRTNAPTGEVKRGVKCFATGGYTVVREVSASNEYMLVMDHGPLGYLSIAAHGHADTLSIWLHVNGRPVIVDAGTYLYHSGKQWRDHMRGTLAHNTLSINREDSSTIAGAFNWSNKAEANLNEIVLSDDDTRITAEHDGYTEKYGVKHVRKIVATSSGVIEVRDILLGANADHPVEVGFLFSPDLNVEKTGEKWFVTDKDGRIQITLAAEEGGLDGSVELGSESVLGGWYSGRFGYKKAAPYLAFRGLMAAQQENIIKISMEPPSKQLETTDTRRQGYIST